VVVSLAALLAMFLTTRLSITADPRMVLQPWLLNQGFIPYLHIADEHSPLLPQLLAWLQIMVNHDAILALRIAQVVTLTLLFTLLNGWLWRRYGPWAMAAGFAFTVAFSLRFGLTTFWYNLALAPLFFAYFIILSDFTDRTLIRRTFYSGVLLGLGILFKQQAVILAPAFVLWLGLVKWNLRIPWRMGVKLLFLYSVGAALPVSLYLAFFLVSGGDLASLVEWVFLFNLTSGYAETGFLLPRHLDIIAIWPAFLLTPPFILSIFVRRDLDRQERSVRLWLLICALSSLIFLYPRYSAAHWAAAFAFVAAMSAITCVDLMRRNTEPTWPTAHPIRLLVISFLFFWTAYGAFLLWPAMAGTAQPRLLKFDEQQELAELLAAKLPAHSTIVFIPDNEAVSNAYYGLQRTPPRFWMMHYPWFMQPHILERWLTELEQHPPDYVIWVDGLQELNSPEPDISAFISKRYRETASFVWQERTVHLLHNKAIE
jgi:hypothetical protein